MKPARDIGSIFGGAVATALDDVWTAAPGRVVSYDVGTRSASVELPIKRPYIDESGTRQTEKLAIVNHVPVMFPGWCRVDFPIAEGDSVLLIFASQSLDRWLARGGADVDPQDPRRNAITDAIAIPGLADFAHVPAPSEKIAFAPASITLSAASVNVGGGSVEPTLKATTFLAALATYHASIGAAFGTISTDPTGATAVTTMSAALSALSSAITPAITLNAKVS